MDFPVLGWRNRCSGHTVPFWPSPVRLQREEPPQRQELRISLVCSFNDPVLQCHHLRFVPPQRTDRGPVLLTAINRPPVKLGVLAILDCEECPAGAVWLDLRASHHRTSSCRSAISFRTLRPGRTRKCTGTNKSNFRRQPELNGDCALQVSGCGGNRLPQGPGAISSTGCSQAKSTIAKPPTLEETPLKYRVTAEIRVFPAQYLRAFALLTRTRPPPTQRGK